ncbi:MAG: methylated-DNA--[protein]-cysteine S-methyltransferase [Cellvibrionaceae bacterium]
MNFTYHRYNKDTHLKFLIDYTIINTDLGKILAAHLDNHLCWLSFINSGRDELTSLQSCFPKHTHQEKKSPQLKAWVNQIIANTGNEAHGEIPLLLKGTDFQYKVWRQLLKIKPGKTLSYSELATKAGNPKASRAVGSAVGKNPICIAIPCHRIIRADGGLGGFSGGIENKKALLLRENPERWACLSS